MSSAPHAPQLLTDISDSVLPRPMDSPSISALSAPDNDNNNDIDHNLMDDHSIGLKHFSISEELDTKHKAIEDDDKMPSKRLTLRTSVSTSNTLDAQPSKSKSRKKSRPRHTNKRNPNFGSKSVAWHDHMSDHDHDKIADLSSSSIKPRKKSKFKKQKRKSITPGHTIQKQLKNHLNSVNQYLLPAPRKHNVYKWVILDPSDLKTKYKRTGNVIDLMKSLNSMIQPSTANISLIQTNELLICLSNISSSAPVILRTHVTQSNNFIKEYFQLPIPIRSYESILNEKSLQDLLSSTREQRVLKAHKNRVKLSNNKGLGRKKINTRWELDLTHKETIRRLKQLHDTNNDIDWAIFDFKDYKKNTKYLIIPDHQFGTGGSEELSKNLAQIDEMRYAVLAMVYGHIVKRRLILLIIWNPLIHNAMMKNTPNDIINTNNNKNGQKKSLLSAPNGNNQNNKPSKTRHHSHSTTIVFWQHKEKIKSFANAKKEMNINLHSKLAESMIISQLHRDGLLDDIIIRVTKTTGNEDISISLNNNKHHQREQSIYDSQLKPTPVPRQWTLKQLKEKLCQDYKMEVNKIRISLVPNIVKRREKSFSSARKESHHHKLLTGDDKKLFELGIDHGSQIYITDQADTTNVQNSVIKKDRIRAWDKLLKSERRKSLSSHRREQTMPIFMFQHTVSTPDVHIRKKKKKSKRKHKKRKKRKKKSREMILAEIEAPTTDLQQTKSNHKSHHSELLIPRTMSQGNKSVGYLPEIRESITSSTPPNEKTLLLMPNNGNLYVSKSASLSKQPSNESLLSLKTDTTTENEDDSDLDFVHHHSAPTTPTIPNEGSVIIKPDFVTEKILNHNTNTNSTDDNKTNNNTNINRIDQLKQKLNMDQDKTTHKKKPKRRHKKKEESKQTQTTTANTKKQPKIKPSSHSNEDKDSDQDPSHLTMQLDTAQTISPSRSLSNDLPISPLESAIANNPQNTYQTVNTNGHRHHHEDVANHVNIAPIISPPSSSDSTPSTKIAPIPAAPAPLPIAPLPLPNSASSPAAAAPAPLPMAPIPGGAPAMTLNGAQPPSIPPVPLLNGKKRKKKKLATRLHELVTETKSDSDEENEADLKPSAIFTDLESKRKSRRKLSVSYSASHTNKETDDMKHSENDGYYDEDGDMDMGDDIEDPLVPLPDTILMTNDELVQTDSNIDLNDIFITTHNVGRGKTASVHQALYKNTVFVAVKEFVFQNLSPAILADFHKEANTLKNLRHPNIAMLVGSYLDEVSGELYIVLEWLPGGCLHDLLHSDEEEMEINYYDVLLMAIDIARGMKYLHSKSIIHRDLKTHNLLLDEEYRVKVTDFGTAKHLDQIKSKAFTEVGTLGYVAPEVLDPPINGYDGKVDVFSYGVILWEIYSCSNGNKSHQDNVLTSVSTLQYAKRLKTGFRPIIPSNCPEEFKDLINGCWEYKPQKRPTFDQIVLYLEKLIKEHQSEFSGNLYNLSQQEYTDEDDEDEDEEYGEEEEYEEYEEYEDDEDEDEDDEDVEYEDDSEQDELDPTSSPPNT